MERDRPFIFWVGPHSAPNGRGNVNTERTGLAETVAYPSTTVSFLSRPCSLLRLSTNRCLKGKADALKLSSVLMRVTLKTGRRWTKSPLSHPHWTRLQLRACRQQASAQRCAGVAKAIFIKAGTDKPGNLIFGFLVWFSPYPLLRAHAGAGCRTNPRC
jgi:hypothetical protein